MANFDESTKKQEERIRAVESKIDTLLDLMNNLMSELKESGSSKKRAKDVPSFKLPPPAKTFEQLKNTEQQLAESAGFSEFYVNITSFLIMFYYLILFL